MKQTKNYLLDLMEAADVLSAKPLNENAEKIDAALLAQRNEIAGKLVLATGTYTGDGAHSRMIETPGFKAKALLVRSDVGVGWVSSLTVDSWWLGRNVPVKYEVQASSDKLVSPFAKLFEEEITFAADMGTLRWSIPELPADYYDVTSDGGPREMCNRSGTTYEWIAFGAAEE